MSFRSETFRLDVCRAVIWLAVIVWLGVPLSMARGASKPGTVYVIHAIDTETRGLIPFVYSQGFDLRDYQAGGEVGRTMVDNFRDMYVDSDGGRVRFTWFALTHELYLQSPGRSVMVALDALDRHADRIERFGDLVGWHYHHADWNNPQDTSRGAGYWKQIRTFDGTRYMHGSDIELAEQMVAMLILDRGYYPSVFRAGWTWENADFSVWLDDVVPFDFSSNAPLTSSTPHSTSDTSGGLYDWSEAPSDWSFYHPDSSDYQKPGHLKRTIFRCFPGHRSSDLNFETAFEEAREGADVLVGAYVHSFEDLAKFCRITTSTLKSAAEVFPEVRYKFVTALEGAQLVLGFADEQPPRVVVRKEGERVTVTSDKALFCFPYGAVRDSSGRYCRVRPVSEEADTSQGDYRWVFDLSVEDYVEFAAGCVDKAGNAVVTEKCGR